MKFPKRTLALIIPLCYGCGDLANKASEAQDTLATLKAEYESFDLSCNFDEISGSSEAQSEVSESATQALADSSSGNSAAACENTAEQYSLLVDKFDSDDDGKLSAAELATAETAWAEAQKAQLDKNADGSISDDEKKSFKAENLPARKEKLIQAFEKNCMEAGKALDACRERRKEHAAEKKEDILKRFDTNGDGKLSPDEVKAMVAGMKAERETAKADILKKRDKNGDGKLSPDELKGPPPADAPAGGAPAGGAAPLPASQLLDTQHEIFGHTELHWSMD